MIPLLAGLLACLSGGGQGKNDPSTEIPPLGEFGESYCEMTELGRIQLPGAYKTAVVQRGSLAYVAADTDGLYIVDLADPYNPTVIGEKRDVGDYSAHRMALNGDLLAIAHLWDGWFLLDVSDPTDPTSVSGTWVDHPDPTATWSLPVTDVWMDDQYAYVAGTHLVIYDISDPTDPLVIGEVPPEWDDTVPDVERLHTSTTVEVVGDYAYLTEADDFFGRVVVVDISDKTDPHVVSWWDGPGDVYQLDVVGDIAFAADLEFGMRTIDLSNPLDPRALDTFRTSGQSYSLDADGDRVYVADNLNGLMGIDVSNPADLSWASFHHVGGKPGRVGLEIGDGDGPWGVAASGGLAAMITTQDLVVLQDCGN